MEAAASFWAWVQANPLIAIIAFAAGALYVLVKMSKRRPPR
jgi:uncharacterized membrane protein